MIPAKGFAASSPTSGFAPLTLTRRSPGPDDILIDIFYCGVCHSDIHTVRDEWEGTRYPVVPGHEILGRVAQVGKGVKKFKIGDMAGVGCFVDSCRKCPACRKGDEQFCPKIVWTYNALDPKDGQPTHGGYSDKITVDFRYAHKIEHGQPLDRVAPLLCAGITTYSPLKHANLPRASKVGIVGLGGLGHVAVKIATAMGYEVTAFSTSLNKKESARKLGAKHFVATKEADAFAGLGSTFDFILDTVSADHDLAPFLASLKMDGSMVLVGAPPDPLKIQSFSLIFGRKKLGGSLIGGLKETQEMLDFCARKKVLADVEVIAPTDLNVAYDRAVAGDVKFRFVVDTKKL
jgi:uncharacterized zinc-type alcohol dehydrogenase-like protein